MHVYQPMYVSGHIHEHIFIASDWQQAIIIVHLIYQWQAERAGAELWPGLGHHTDLS